MPPNCTSGNGEGDTRCACSQPDSPCDKVTTTEACARCRANFGSKAHICNGTGDNLSLGNSSNTSTLGGVSSHDVLPLPPDGGWGWVVLVASHLCNFVVDGICSSFGVFLPHLLEYFGEGRAKTAFAGTLMPGVYLFSGPVASVLVNKFGCRKVTIAGGLLTTVALILASLAPSINMFIVCYGILAGFGMSLIYLPAAVMVGYYFDRKRGLATGISSSGSGLGMLIIAPLTAILNTVYTWQGSMLILSGLAMQCVIMGGLMRPLDITTAKCVDVTDELCLFSETEQGSMDDLDEQEGGLVNCKDPQALTPIEPVHGMHCTSAYEHQSNRPLLNSSALASRLIGYLTTPQTSSCYELYDGQRQESTMDVTKPPVAGSRNTSKKNAVSHSCHNLTSKGHGDNNGESSHSRPVVERSRSSCRPRRTHFLVNPLTRKDIFFSGSVNTLPEYKSQGDMNSYVASVTVLPQRQEEDEELEEKENMGLDETYEQGRPGTCCRASCVSRSDLNTMMYMLDVSILANPYFLIICAASVFIQVAFYIPIVFIADYGISLGLEAGRAASLIAVMGASSLIGRTGAGALASVSWVGPLHINNISLMLAGLSTILAMIWADNFHKLLIYAAVYGLLVSAFVPLTTVFLVKYMGLDKLTNAFGFLSLVRGVASMMGAPLGVAIVEATSSYQLAFHFAGVLLIAAGLIHYLLPVVQRCRKVSSSSQLDEIYV